MSEAPKSPTECPATNLLKEGRRHFICGEYVPAVEKLSEACEKMAEKHGEGNVILAHVFYSYGEALLEMARMETPVLGNALKDVPEVLAESDGKEVVSDNGSKEETEEKDESLDEEAKEDIADKVIDALCEAPVMEAGESAPEESKKSVSAEKSEHSAENKEIENDKEVESEDAASGDVQKEAAVKMDEQAEKEDAKDDGEAKENEQADEDDKGENDEEGEENDEEEEGDDETEENTQNDGNEDDVGHLQLAWETIEVARTLFVKKSETESDKEEIVKSKLRIADCHRKLGEVLMERDEWTQAAEEFRKCLEIEKENLDHPNRRIAETNFEIGVAYDNAEKSAESSDAFQESAKILQEFQKKLMSGDSKSADDEKEIKELDSVLEEIQTRIAEVKQKALNQPQNSDEAGASSSNGIATNGFGSSNGTTTIGFGGESTTNGFHHTSEKAESTKETQDITHLIRKRPKESDTTESPVKKVRVDATASENL